MISLSQGGGSQDHTFGILEEKIIQSKGKETRGLVRNIMTTWPVRFCLDLGAMPNSAQGIDSGGGTYSIE